MRNIIKNLKVSFQRIYFYVIIYYYYVIKMMLNNFKLNNKSYINIIKFLNNIFIKTKTISNIIRVYINKLKLFFINLILKK
jgi:hypothetical protein